MSLLTQNAGSDDGAVYHDPPTQSGDLFGGDTYSALVRRARLGDSRAFAQLVRNHQSRAIALATGLVRDEHDAREIVQEAFLRVFRGLDGFAGNSAFYTWLYRIVTNLAIDFLRKPARREAEYVDPQSADDRGELELFFAPAADPFGELSNKQLQERIHRSVAALPPYHRGVIEMRELHGMSYEEMAHAMGVSKGTIMSRLFHARQKLQRSLGSCLAEFSG
jgi:RNA polymerase sigma-70 factor (ECF subfamily)